MKMKIKKIISLALSLVTIFSTCESVFAGKGDPLQEHRDYIGLIRKEFELTGGDTQNSNYPAVWKKKPNFWFWADDYRTTVVYNIPYLMCTDVNKNFFKATAKALIKSRRSAFYAKRVAKGSAKLAIKIFKEDYAEELKNSSDIKTIAEFLGTPDEETAINACVCAIGMTWLCSAGHIASLAAFFSGALGTITAANPLAGLAASAALDAFCIATGYSKFKMEATQNYATALHGVWRMLENKTQHERIMDSNVLVTAVDKRKFSPFLRYNVLRRNDGAWCNFVEIGNLKCAPKANKYKYRNLIAEYLQVYNQVMTNGNLDLEKLENWVNYGTLPITNSLDPNQDSEQDPEQNQGQERSPKAEIKAGPKAEIKAGPKAEIRTGPKAEIRTGPKTEPKAGPKARPKAESK